jgi:Lrp/AsnC family transcriptional regulator, leucine-responsive regulatory protein
MARSSGEQILEDETRVLEELIKNSKENIDMIAKHCGFSRQKVWRIMKQLDKKGFIWGYTAIFDEMKVGLNHYMLLVKRTTKQIGEKTIATIVERKIEEFAANLGVTVESSYYVHGSYDWIVTFTAKEITQAKRFSDALVALHPDIIEEIQIVQTLMFIKKQYILNPEKKKLKDFL